ncbi:MAG: beta-galactosidase [Candidatus Theseobacter exili]|nr:beta-galactosidase [Candidatus Theseobacter exili]
MMLVKKVSVYIVCCFSFVLVNSLAADEDIRGWEKAKYFRIEEIEGRKIFIDPYGTPFYAVSMVYSFGPEGIVGTDKRLSLEEVLQEFEAMKLQGFNTVDLYGSDYFEEILDWCEKNEMALYPRASFGSLKGLSPERREFPDFMDPEFRAQVKDYYRSYLLKIKDYSCILAVNLDQRWLFSIDYTRCFRNGDPRIGPCGIKCFPEWLKNKYGLIEKINIAWNKNYRSFNDVIKDPEIIRGQNVLKLEDKPWRVEIIEYTLWTINDFLKDLTASMRIVDPNHLLTITSDLPEAIPFPISTSENSGIDFISTVHYNYLTDYGRDWIGANRVIFSTKFIYDFSNNNPVFINETGYRTSTLGQAPPNRAYAMGKQDDEAFIAEMYLDQALLFQSLPWLCGWAFFKWYDKHPEGDFGYLRDYGTLKPVSEIGKIINPFLPVNFMAEKDPDFVIYYPEYFLASRKAGSNQFTALISIIQKRYLAKHSKTIEKMYNLIIANGTESAAKLDMQNLISSFNNTWIPFKFTNELPEGADKLVVIAGRQSEQLSIEDREKLMSRNILCFDRAGLTDERYNETAPWYLESVGLMPSEYTEKYIYVDLFTSKETDYKSFLASDKSIITARESAVTFVFPIIENDVFKYIICSGQSINLPTNAYTAVNFLAGSSRGNIARTVILNYTDGSQEKKYLGTTINDMNFKSNTGRVGWFGKPGPESPEIDLSLITVPISPAKNLESIVLPDEPLLRVYAVTLTEGGIAEKVDITVMLENQEVFGYTDWVVSVRNLTDEELKNAPFKIVARFKNDRPAILMSKDGKHISFLYDALGWSDNKKEISLNVEAHSKLLYGLINSFIKKSREEK